MNTECQYDETGTEHAWVDIYLRDVSCVCFCAGSQHRPIVEFAIDDMQKLLKRRQRLEKPRRPAVPGAVPGWRGAGGRGSTSTRGDAGVSAGAQSERGGRGRADGGGGRGGDRDRGPGGVAGVPGGSRGGRPGRGRGRASFSADGQGTPGGGVGTPTAGRTGAGRASGPGRAGPGRGGVRKPGGGRRPGGRR